METLSNKCPFCDESGISIMGDAIGTCPRCDGTSRLVIGEMFIGNVTKLIYTHQIVAIINPTEYASLGEAAKDGLRIILSCGLVDLVHTGNIYLNLMAIFGSSPITKAAITAL
jgi:hypothetical protein